MDYRTNTEVYLFIITGIIILNAFLGFIVYFIFMYRRKQKANRVEKHDLHFQFQKTLMQAQLEIQEHTFKNISQEIHDNIGQVLSLAKLNLSAIELNPEDDCREKAMGAKRLVSKAIQDLRDLSRSLNTDYVSEMGLAKAIEYELEMIRKSALYETALSINGTASSFGKQKELILFRIIQEVLNNIIKHANATLIRVALEYGTDFFCLTVSDNGNGFDLGRLKKDERFGLGIRNMHNRATLIDADFRITSTLGSGSTVQLMINGAAFTKKLSDE
jgi:two-component system NarL family sensor kinase